LPATPPPPLAPFPHPLVLSPVDFDNLTDTYEEEAGLSLVSPFLNKLLRMRGSIEFPGAGEQVGDCRAPLRFAHLLIDVRSSLVICLPTRLSHFVAQSPRQSSLACQSPAPAETGCTEQPCTFSGKTVILLFIIITKIMTIFLFFSLLFVASECLLTFSYANADAAANMTVTVGEFFLFKFF
jgi:hypothetical protein